MNLIVNDFFNLIVKKYCFEVVMVKEAVVVTYNQSTQAYLGETIKEGMILKGYFPNRILS